MKIASTPGVSRIGIDIKTSTFHNLGGTYNQADAGGFIKLNALRMRIAGNLAKTRGRKK